MAAYRENVLCRSCTDVCRLWARLAACSARASSERSWVAMRKSRSSSPCLARCSAEYVSASSYICTANPMNQSISHACHSVQATRAMETWLYRGIFRALIDGSEQIPSSSPCLGRCRAEYVSANSCVCQLDQSEHRPCSSQHSGCTGYANLTIQENQNATRTRQTIHMPLWLAL